VIRLQLMAGEERRIQTPVPLWLAAVRLNATASDKTARRCQEKVRTRPVPVSVAERMASVPWLCRQSAHEARPPDGSRGSSWPSPKSG